MARYYVWKDATGTNAGTSWTNAYTAFGSAVTAATTAGDEIFVHYTHQEEVGIATTYTFGADNIQVWSVNKDSSDAPTVMGTGGWLGNSTTARTITFTAAGRKIWLYGITVRTASSTNADIGFNGDGGHFVLESCYLWQGSTSTNALLRLGAFNDQQNFVSVKDCTFRFGNTAQQIQVGGRVEILGGSISSAGSAITTVFRTNTSNDLTGCMVECHGFDISAASSTATILGDNSITPCTLKMYACKLPSGAITYLGTQTFVNRTTGEVWLHDCAAGDTHLGFVYANPFGTVELQTGVYFTTTGAAWKVTTTSATNYRTPFETPWIDLYHTGTSAITPYLEVMRDGSTTAYTDAEVWGEFSVKSNTGFVTPSFGSDRQSLTSYLAGTAASNQAAGAGLGSWTGEGGSAWSGKVDRGSSVTPAETGYIRGRVVVAAASVTALYVDPVIRT